MHTHVHEHVHACLFPVSAVPDSTLLLASGVLECWKCLAGRFNIQLTGSRSSYITAETNPPFTIVVIPWLVSHPPPPSLWSHLSCLLYCLWPLLEQLRCVCMSGRGGGERCSCLSISPPADCIWSEWIVFHLEVIAHTPAPFHPAVGRTDAQVGRGKEEGSGQHDWGITRMLPSLFVRVSTCWWCWTDFSITPAKNCLNKTSGDVLFIYYYLGRVPSPSVSTCSMHSCLAPEC